MSTPQADNRPNIIYILGDDHRQDYTHLGQNRIIQTPSLDALAAEGTYFEHSFCTSPACTPSRACHYTGQWERSHGINFNSNTCVSPTAWESTFPMILKKQGYQTAWVGKNHVPVGEGAYIGGYMETTFDYWYGNHGHSTFYPKESVDFGEMYQNAKADTQVEIFEEGAMNFLDPQKEFIESAHHPLIYRDKSKPFCMCLTFNLPHAASTNGMQQRETDDEIYRTLYRDKLDEFQPPHSYVPYDERTPRLPVDLYSGDYIKCYNYVRTVASLQEMQIRVCQTVTGMDRMIGHLREKLEELGISDNTIIVFSTDHGIHYGEHGLGGKCFLYEECIRIPMMIYDPRAPKEQRGKHIQEMVAVPDLAPTVLELLGVEIPDTMQGQSLVPLMKGEDIPWRDELFVEQLMDTQNYPKSEAIRTKEWKYIRYFQRTEIPGNTAPFRKTMDNYDDFLLNSYDTSYKTAAYEELYHLTDDPYEDTNLAQDPQYAEQMAYFRTRIAEHLQALLLENHDERIVHNYNVRYPL